jgi:ABC-type uncharacterized transport system substrate-binding protein
LVRWRFLLLSLCLFIAGTCVHAAVAVVIVSSERSAPYVEAAEALISELERSGLSRYEMLQLSTLEWASAGALRPRIFVALGTEAAQALARGAPGAPVLCALLPRTSFERVLMAGGRKASPQFSALYLDQPLGRQLELIHRALPAARRLGVLWGPESQSQASSLKTQAQASGLEVVEATVGRDESLFSSLKRVLEDADVLLAVADPQVYNSNSVQNILLASFRARVPLVAFSPAYVRAGALFALHVTPTQIGRQAATMARGVLQGKALPANPVYSQDFSVTVNEHVAHSLGLTLDGEALRAHLRSREGTP